MFVSVIVPCYNHAPYLKQRIESILNQTYENFELILLDDVSPDESAKILLSYKDHPKVSHCIINENNSGSTFHQWNKGIALAQGELIWIAESDDAADPLFLETLVNPFQHNPNLVLAYSQSYRMDSQGNITGSWKDYTNDLDIQRFENDFTMSGLDYIYQFLIIKNTVPNASAVLFKKQIYQKVGGANPNRKFIGDWEIWSKILSLGDVFYHAKHLNYFRYHEMSVIARAVRGSKTLDLRNDILVFRETIGYFWEKISLNDPRFNSILKKNKEQYFKAINRNTSLSIRKRYYREIIPNTIKTLKTCPKHITPFLTIKLIIKLTYSIFFDLPFNKVKSVLKREK